MCEPQVLVFPGRVWLVFRCSVVQSCQFTALGLILNLLSVSQGCLTRPQISILLHVLQPYPLLIINNFYGKTFSSYFLYCETF